MAYCYSCRKNKVGVNLRDLTMKKDTKEVVNEEVANNIEVVAETVVAKDLTVEEIVAIRRKQMDAPVVNK